MFCVSRHLYIFQCVICVAGKYKHPVCGFFLLLIVLEGNAQQQYLQIKTSTAETIEFEIEIAATAEQRRQGLMFRTQLPDQSGMLLDYNTPREVSIWMKNTRIPLDILFINQQGEIVKIFRNARPGNLESIHSGSKVRAVLEVNAGVVDQYAITTGNRAHHEIFEQ